MKKTSVLISGIFVLVFFTAWGFFSNLNSNPLETQDNIPVEEFSSVAVGVRSTVYLEQGSSHSLEIDASPDDLDKIEINVQNEKLIIKPKDYKTKIRGEVIINIVAPDFESLELAGSGKMIGEGKMNLNEIEMVVSGSGEMIFDDLKADEVEVKISGSGKMELIGEGADELEVSIAGSGDIIAVEFEVDEFDAKISGSGNCEVFVTGELDATIAGSGSVYYKGNPQVDTSIAGSGKVKKL